MAEQLLSNLPCKGSFTDAVIQPVKSDGFPVYVCVHDTSPPVERIIRTDPTNILIRSLILKNNKSDSKQRDSKKKNIADNAKGKRPADKQLDDRVRVKRASSNSVTITSDNGASSETFSEKDLQNYTVDRLRSLLKERGLPTKGKKDELIARLRR
eukprot:TRINITY_DN22596_c0_g1_i1.p1 TRINITY_DN22596_c0_g1~~TRINITY_DN22596_c0_g1_i1.p1  ORF type:complete len:155 (+),score=35.63 TRINITY_DN22596_c0_g1_i1:287-751(+)